MATSDQLVPLLEECGLTKQASSILALAKPALILKKRTIAERRPAKPKWFGLVQPKDQILERPAPVTRGGSKIGGHPDFPLEASWPKCEQGHLDFICQLSCAEVHSAQSIPGIPLEGTVYFFFDISGAWDSTDADPNMVFHYQSPAPTCDGELQRQTTKVVLPEYPIDFVPVVTVPDHDSREIDTLSLGRKDQAAYKRFANSVSKLCGRKAGYGHHQLGGYAMRVQGEVRAEFEAYNGYKGPAPDSDAWRRAYETSPAWSLLLQIDSDDDLNLMWGDAGMLYYGIRQRDLAESRFSASRTTVQCC